jgi:uncharacterized membrane protein
MAGVSHGGLHTVDDPHRAPWVAQMGLSILWGCFATVLLAVGFMRHVRSLRLAALGLFGLTAGKLAVVDLPVSRRSIASSPLWPWVA